MRSPRTSLMGNFDSNQSNDKSYTVKLFSINCRSLRNQDKRNQLAVLLVHYNIDVVFISETAHLFICLKSYRNLSYKTIKKDRCLGGGGVLIGFKYTLTISEISITTEAEIVWCTLQFLNEKSLYLCSFYRPPDSRVYPMVELDKILTTVPLDLNLTLASTYSRALTPFHRAVGRCLRASVTCSRA